LNELKQLVERMGDTEFRVGLKKFGKKSGISLVNSKGDLGSFGARVLQEGVMND